MYNNQPQFHKERKQKQNDNTIHACWLQCSGFRVEASGSRVPSPNPKASTHRGGKSADPGPQISSPKATKSDTVLWCFGQVFNFCVVSPRRNESKVLLSFKSTFGFRLTNPNHQSLCTVALQKAYSGWPMVGQWLAHGWPMVGQWLANGWPMAGQWLANGWPMVGQWLAHGWPMVGPNPNPNPKEQPKPHHLSHQIF